MVSPAYAITTKNADYVKMRGWESVVSSDQYRKELVAGNLAEHAIIGEHLICSIAIEPLTAILVT